MQKGISVLCLIELTIAQAAFSASSIDIDRIVNANADKGTSSAKRISMQDMPGMSDMSDMDMSSSGPEAVEKLGTSSPMPILPGATTTSDFPASFSEPSYTLSQLEDLALAHNPTLVQAQAQITGEKGKAKQAGLPPNPSVSYVGELLGLRRAGAGEFQGAMLAQEFILGGKLKYSRKKYQARVSAAEKQQIAQQLRVLNDVRVAFYGVLAHAEQLRLEKDLLKVARDHWLTKHEMFNMGQSNQSGLHEANIYLEKQNLKVIAQENDLALAWQELTTVVGIDVPYRPLTGKLEGDVPDLNWNMALSNLLTESPELAQAKMKLRADELTVQREKRQLMPNMVLCGGAGYDQLDTSFAAQAGAAITNIPLFNRNQGTIQQAQADLERQKAEVQLVELNLRRRLAWHYRQYKTASQYVKSYRNLIVPEARKNYAIVLRSYMNTRLEWPEVLAAQRQYFDARREYINHLFACRAAAIEIEGYLLSGGLVAPPGVTPPGHIDATPQPR